MILERIKEYPDGIANVFRRFPLALFFSLAATVIFILDQTIRFRFTRINGVDCIKEWLLYYPLGAMGIAFAVSLVFETVANKRFRVLTHLSANLFWAALCAILIYSYGSLEDESLRFSLSACYVTIFSAPIIMPFLKQENDTPLWFYACRLLSNTALAASISLVFFGILWGLMDCIFSLVNYQGSNSPYFEDIAIFSFCFLTPLLALSAQPHLKSEAPAAALGKIRELVDFGKVSGLVGSVASLVTSAFVALFAIVFISFFFLKDEGLFERIVCALVPDKHELTLSKTLSEIKQLLSRYFGGLVIEMLGVALVDFLGLWFIARIDFSYAIGIAFIAGILNVIPYVGPIFGAGIGVVFGIVLKLGTGAGLAVNIWLFALIILAIMLSAQLIDNLIYQPLIYSTSIKAHPLEIFIVLLMAGHIGGTVGMLVAIPAYTVVRVVAIRFFYRYKIIQRLVPNLSDEDKIIENID